MNGPRKANSRFLSNPAVVEPGKRRTIYWDKNFRTFGLFVSDTGHKSYVLQYRDRNTRQQSRVTFKCDLGEQTKIGFKEAKELAKEALLRVQLGGRPLIEIGSKAREGQTFKAVADEYLKVLEAGAAKDDLRQSSLDAIERQLVGKERTKKVHWKPLHSVAITGIDRATVATRLRKIAEQHGPGAADRYGAGRTFPRSLPGRSGKASVTSIPSRAQTVRARVRNANAP